jgi:hypothetical protein
MATIQIRNRSSHTYNEKTANEIAAAILSSFVQRSTGSIKTGSAVTAALPVPWHRCGWPFIPIRRIPKAVTRFVGVAPFD